MAGGRYSAAMILVVGALPSELRSLGPPPRRSRGREQGDVVVFRCGTGLEGGRAAAAEIATRRPSLVLHVGIAGGLRGGLGMGDLVVVTATSNGVLAVDAGGALPPSLPCGGGEELRTALALLPDRMAQGAILTVDRFVPDAATKEAIGRAGTYLACEMEAAPIAAAAAAAGAAYLGLRAISDPCDTTVLGDLRSGRAVRAAMSPVGALAGWRSVKGLRRALAALDRAVPVALGVAQAMSSISAPASSTNSSGT